MLEYDDIPNPRFGSRYGEFVRYSYLLYSLLFLIDPWLSHSPAKWLALAIAYPIFVALYIGMTSRRTPDRMRVLLLWGMFAISYLYYPFNEGASGIFVYPVAALPFFYANNRLVFKILAAQILGIIIEGTLCHFSYLGIVLGVFFCFVITFSNLYHALQMRSDAKLRLAHEEIEQLAKVAERERIARDLHDLLGHTLTVIALKSELAEHLVARDPEAATREISEIHRTSRKALAEVREAVLGYRCNGLAAELDRAHHVLAVAGVALTADPAPTNLLAADESILALAVREAVTNIMRHSKATICRMAFITANGRLKLTVQDNGCGGPLKEGFGLRGMRERVEAIGGRFSIATENGTCLTIDLPRTGAQA